MATKTRNRFGTLDGKVHPDVVYAFREVSTSLDTLHNKSDQQAVQLAQAASAKDLQQAKGQIQLLQQQVANLLNKVHAVATAVAVPPTPPGPPVPPNPGGGGGGGGGPVPGQTVTTIDGHPVTIYSSPDVTGWAETTTITLVELVANGGLLVHFTKKLAGPRWPDVPISQTGTIQYTIWFVEFINGAWATAGGVECWFDPPDTQGFGGNVVSDTQIGNNIYYNPQIWGPMAQFQPAAGVTVGIMVTSGDQRVKDLHTVTERSPIYWVVWPASSATPQTFATAPNPSP